ncbi:MAG TPA: hypothetical protein ENK11_04525 [Phycisphaerales bacterium]|nr:hypothetical protein [Phycisphaerales bacterium]
MNNIGSLLQIIVFIAVITGPVIGNIAKKVKEQADQRRLEAERERRKIEAIRRGQPVEQSASAERAPSARRDESSAAAKRAKLEALQKRRREQIEELRRRMRESQTGQRPATPRAGGASSRGVTKTQPVPPAQHELPPVARQDRPERQTRPTRSVAQAELERRRAVLRARREEYEKAKAQAERAKRAQSEAARAKKKKSARTETHRPVPLPVPLHAVTPIDPASLAATMRDPSSFRRAIVLNELLSPPIALRESHL